MLQYKIDFFFRSKLTLTSSKYIFKSTRRQKKYIYVKKYELVLFEQKTLHVDRKKSLSLNRNSLYSCLVSTTDETRPPRCKDFDEFKEKYFIHIVQYSFELDLS